MSSVPRIQDRVHDITDVDAVQYEPLHLLEDLPSIDLLLGVPGERGVHELFHFKAEQVCFPDQLMKILMLRTPTG